MADWEGRVWDKEIVSGPFTGGGLWVGRVWPAAGDVDLRACVRAISSTQCRIEFLQQLASASSSAGDYNITGPQSVSIVSASVGADYILITHSEITMPGTYLLDVETTVVSAAGVQRTFTDLTYLPLANEPDEPCPECAEDPFVGAPWFTINGLETKRIVTIAGQPTGERRDVGAQHEATDGSLTVTRQARKRDFKFTTILLTAMKARVWSGLITGEGHVWPFDSHFYSSKGLVGVGSIPPPDVRIQTGAFKYGGGALEVAGGETWQADNVISTGDPWTVSVWGKTNAGSWKHYVQRSDGAKWVDAVRNDSFVMTNIFEMIGNSIYLTQQSPDFVKYFDDLVVVPYLWLSDWPAQVFADTKAFGPAPRLTCAGLLVPEAETRTMIGPKCDERIALATIDGNRYRDLRELSVELKGV